MPSLVHLRGANCAGKTTAVRQYVLRAGVDHVIQVDTSQGAAPVTVLANGVAVLGTYGTGSKFGGCDHYRNRRMLVEVVRYLLSEIRPAGVVVEGLIYGLTCKITQDLTSICECYGYEYHGLYLHREFEESLALLYERKGGRPVNEGSLFNKCVQARNSYEKLKRMGYNMELVKVSCIPKDDMWQVVERALKRES